MHVEDDFSLMPIQPIQEREPLSAAELEQMQHSLIEISEKIESLTIDSFAFKPTPTPKRSIFQKSLHWIRESVVEAFEKVEDNVLKPMEVSAELTEKANSVATCVEVFFKVGEMMKSITEKVEFIKGPLAVFGMLSLLKTGWEVIQLDPSVQIHSRVLSGIEFLGISGEITSNISKVTEAVGKFTHMASYTVHALKIAGAVGVVVSALTLIASVRGMVQTRLALSEYRRQVGTDDAKDIGKGIDFLKGKGEKKLRSLLNVSGHIPLIEKKVNLTEKIDRAFKAATTDQKKEELDKLIKKQFRISTITKALAGVAAAASLIGVIILTFTPLGPLAWTFILLGIGISVGLLAYNKIQSAEFINELDRIGGVLPDAKPQDFIPSWESAYLIPPARPISHEAHLHPPAGGASGQSRRNIKQQTLEIKKPSKDIAEELREIAERIPDEMEELDRLLHEKDDEDKKAQGLDA